MAAEFTPEFGPNGSVLNAPSMTPEMRAELTGNGLRAPRRTTLVPTIFAVLAAESAINLTASSELAKGWSKLWVSGFVTGVVTVMGLVAAVRIVRERLWRWELAGPSSADRRLRMPTAARWSFFVAEAGAVLCFVAFAILWIAHPSDMIWSAVYLPGPAAIAFLCVLPALIYVADWRGWTWRAPP